MTDSAATHAPFLLRDVRLFDGHTLTPRTELLVRDGRIATGPAGDATVLDCAGRSVLPGLIDAHTHAATPAHLAEALRFGVTTELDMFADPPTMRELRALAATRPDLADVRSAGTGATAPGGHPRGMFPPFPTIDHPARAAEFVADRIAEGSDYLKIILDDGTSRRGRLPTLDDPTLRALVAAARERGLLTLAHATDHRAAARAVESGVDGLAHLFVDTPPEPDFADRARKAGAFAIPTLTALHGGWGEPAVAADLRDDPRIRPWLGADAVAQLSRESYAPPHARRGPEHAAAATRLLHAAGVPILAGTDVAIAAHGASLHLELELLVAAGLTATEALTAATATPAAIFGLTDRGRIAPGLRADLLLVHGDPTEDITATRAIAGVWRGGVAVNRE